MAWGISVFDFIKDKTLTTAPNASFEVEIRFRFQNHQEVYRVLPFLRSKLRHDGEWETTIYGQDLFKSGELLRLSKVVLDEKIRWFFAWKGPDLGEFANIRQEIGEEVTNGVIESQILQFLNGEKDIRSPQDLDLKLGLLGYERFMSFTGNNYVGFFEPLGLDVKFMHSADLKWPLLVEVEKTAETREEAAHCEQKLRQFCETFDLLEIIVKEEPPTLLYSNIVSEKS